VGRTTATDHALSDMLGSLARVVVLVDDQNAALAFYRDALGFATLHDQEAGGLRYLHAGPEGGGAGVWLLPALSPEDRALVGRQAGAHPLLVVHVGDLDAARRRLERCGTEIFDERDDPGSRSLQFRDVSGNVIVAAQLR
jgi:predicted enzyme related to lactoylglutathione lyase